MIFAAIKPNFSGFMHTFPYDFCNYDYLASRLYVKAGAC